MQKLDRTGTATGIVGTLGVPGFNGSASAQPGLAMPINGQAAFPAAAFPGQPLIPAAPQVVGNPTEFLLLKNLFDPGSESDPDFFLDIKEDVEGEIGPPMKSTKQQMEEASKPPTKRKATRSTAGYKKSTSCYTVQQSNAKRQREHLVGGKEELHKKNGQSQEQGRSGLDKVSAPVAADKLSSVSHEHQTILVPSAKIKLQLFPLDERIGMELEKDGYNPHLELTMSARKRISSVLKHIHDKWGSSTVALGEPVLFPFNIKLERLASYRCWTLNESSITAGDVHAAMGRPAIFRLRYGWFSTQQKSTLGPSTSLLACTQANASPEGCGIMEALTPTKAISGELKVVNVFEQPTIGKVEHLPPVDPSNAEGPEKGVSHASPLWIDRFSNISIGGLLSEASMVGKCNMLDLKSVDVFSSNHLKSAQESADNRLAIQSSTMDAYWAYHLNNDPEEKSCREDLQPSQQIADTFDASVASYMRNAQEPRTLSIPSSILDAEETCHSFAFKKPHSSEKEFTGDGRRFFAAVTAQDPVLDSHNSTKATEASNKQDGRADHNLEPEAQCSKVLFIDESSHGFSKISWSDSMEAFDLGLSSQQMMKGDSISFSEFVR